MATLTVYGDASGGEIDSVGTSYASARNGSNFAVYINDGYYVGQLTGGGQFAVYESFLSYNTSAIPDNNVVTSATESLYLKLDNTTTDYTEEVRAYNWGDTLTSADWITGDNLSNYALLSSKNVSPTSEYNIFPSSVAFCNAININGSTKLVHSSNKTRTNISPTNSEYCSWYSPSYTGTTRDPKLTITYEEGSTPETHSGTVSITSTAATTASGAKATGASVSITHTADTTAQGIKQATATASIAATTATEATGTAQRQGAANITATAETATTGTKSASGTAHITAATETNAVGTSEIIVSKSGTAEITAITGTAASGYKSASGTAAIQLSTELSTLATKTAYGSAEITAQTATSATGTAEITVPTASGTAHVTATATTSASGYKSTTASAEVTAAITLSLSGSKSTSGTASVEAVTGVTVAAFKAAYGNADIIAVVATEASGTVNEYTATIITQTRRVTYKASHTKTTYTAKTNRSRAIWKAEG